MEGQKKKSRSMLIFYIVSVSIGMIFGLIGAMYSEEIFKGEDRNHFAEFFVPIACLYFVLFIQIIIHEGGHLIFGLLSGYKFESFRVGDIVLVNTKEGFKFRKFYLGGTGGQCLMSPPEMKDESCPYLLYNLGGIIANIVSSLLAIILYKFINAGPYVSIVIIEFFAIGIIYAFLNGIPVPMGGVHNDGYNVLSLSKNKIAVKGFWTQMKINGLTTKGVRLKDMDESLFAMPDKEDLQNPICAGVGVFACSREIDSMNFEAGKKIGQDLVENIDNLPLIHKYMVTSEIIFCELVGNNNKEYIDEMHTEELKKFLKVANKYISILRIKYAYSLLYNDDEEEAKKYLASFEKLAKNYIHECEVEGERELIEHVNKLYYK